MERENLQGEVASKIISLEDYRNKHKQIETRTPWGDFPPVFLFSPLGTAKEHLDYTKAKQEGDSIASLRLVRDIIDDGKISELCNFIGDRLPLIVPVHAIEEFGTNKIPAACAYHLSEKIGCGRCEDIVQVNRPERTNKSAFYRLSHYPFFDGKVIADQDYIIVDDTLTMGGTLASLRGFIENKGGNVVISIALTGHPGAANLKLKQNMLQAIDKKHGEELNEWWKTKIGFGLDKLTQGEAGHIKKAPSVDEIRSRIAESRSEK